MTIGQKIQPAKSRNVMGPLPMLPESDDNYGSDACALLCLHPVISSPPILVRKIFLGVVFIGVKVKFTAGYTKTNSQKFMMQ